MRFRRASIGSVFVLSVAALALSCSQGGLRSGANDGGLLSAADPCAAPASGFGLASGMVPAGAAGRACAGGGGACGADLSGYSLPRATLRPVARTAKPKTWKRSSVTPNASKLSVGDKDDLPMEAMDVAVHIDGFRARVTLDMFYRNDRETQLQGTFSLRLPNGASPHYLAFGETTLEKPIFAGLVPATIADIRMQREETWDAPKEARMVPRTKAAHAYAETVRQAIDPALMEWSGSGVFSTSVYPLMPGKLHRIVVGYDVDLVRLGEDLLYRLDLPEDVGTLEVNLSIAGGGADLEITPAVVPKEGRYHWRNPAERTVVARLRNAGDVMLRGTDPAVARFAAQFRPSLPAAAGGAKDRAVFLVDTSLSANPDQFNVQLALLGAILEKNRAELREFAILFFNVETVWWKPGFQPNTHSTAKAALEYAGTLALEGATDVGQAFRAAATLPGAYDVFLLSDGAVTWGEDDLYALSRELGAGHALFAYATGLAGSDRRTLSHLARESGGALFSVTGEAALDEAAVAHRKRPWRITGVSIEGGSDLLLAGRPTTLFPGQLLTVAGRGRPAEDARLVLTLEREGDTQTLRTEIDRHLTSALPARIYGQIAVAQLEDIGADTAVARAYASLYRVVGKTCSLLMLDSEADYERYGIQPEEDAFLVEKQRAAELVAETLAAQGNALGDPKRRFLAWLERLEGLDAAQVKLPDALKLALKEMPTESFDVQPAPVTSQVRRRRDLPRKLRKALADHSFTYDGINAEAERRRRKHGPQDALKALSTMVEHHPGDLVLARDVAFTLMEWELDGQAYGLLRRVVEKRPHEHPTFYAIALVLEELGKVDLAMAFYETALSVPAGRYGDLGLIVAFDYLRMLRLIERGRLHTSVPAFAKARLLTVAKKPVVQEADLVLVMAWNTDRTDVDLHVTDPTGQVCMYSHPNTKIGGHLTADVTQGFGPEMFVLKDAVPGTYLADAHYFSSDATATGTRSKIYVTLYEDWGRENERVLRKTITLSKRGEKQRIATVRRGR